MHKATITALLLSFTTPALAEDKKPHARVYIERAGVDGHAQMDLADDELHAIGNGMFVRSNGKIVMLCGGQSCAATQCPGTLTMGVIDGPQTTVLCVPFEASKPKRQDQTI